MATQTLVKHGTQAGYKAEKKSGNVCDRCRKASRVYYYQYSDAGKAQNLKFSTHDVIDHLYGKATQPKSKQTQTRQPGEATPPSVPELPGQDDTAQADTTQPGIGERLTDALKGFTLSAEKKSDTYIETEEIPDYLDQLSPDPEPAGDDWARVKDDEYLITPQGMEAIQDSMGTYLSVISMTLSLMDPYCAPTDQEIHGLVIHWSKVVARYPKAAKLFMSETSGVIFDWIGAIQATWPILYRIYEHHLSGTIKTEGRRVYRVNPNGHHPNEGVDNLTPEFEYTTQ